MNHLDKLAEITVGEHKDLIPEVSRALRWAKIFSLHEARMVWEILGSRREFKEWIDNRISELQDGA